MIGALLGLGLLVAFIGSAVTSDLAGIWGSPSETAIAAGPMLVGGLLIGFLFPRTVGLTAVGYSAGSLIAALIALPTGQAGYFLPLLLHLGVAILLGIAARIRMGGTAY